ncbi:MAG: sulfatase-like hydrolase/transferase [Verrucomicrobiota bacterium]
MDTKSKFPLTAFLSLLAAVLSPLVAAPNVIVIYTDDQGTLDLNSYGSDDLVTPHMDSIVASGVKFTQFYAAPVCTPSRVSLLTGKSPQRAGVTGNVAAVPNQTAGLSPDEYTMVDLFKDAGYRTAHIGKWHLGFSEDKQPLAHGFDYSFGHLVGCIDNFSHFYYWRGPNRHDLYRNGKEVFHDGEFFPELMVKEANAFIAQNQTRPFFLYFALNLPHYPYQGYPKWLKYYDEKGVPYPRNLYAAFLSTQDDIIGRLLENLDTLGLRENTIIIFQSDNGHSTEERAHFGGGNAGIYRGAKACLFEGGIRVPAAISWPGEIPSGAVRDQLCVNTDWLPTLAELCGLEMPDQEIEGKSLLSLINDPQAESPHQDGYFWKFRDQWAARKGKWKLLGNPVDKSERAPLTEGDRLFLVDLEADPGEMNNLASQFPETVEALQKAYLSWENSY